MINYLQLKTYSNCLRVLILVISIVVLLQGVISKSGFILKVQFLSPKIVLTENTARYEDRLLNEQVEKIRSKYHGIKIAVVGAKKPTEEYTSDIGVEVGKRLRKWLNENKGFAFSGGVEGVTLDMYRGICFVVREQNASDELFFVLLPDKARECPINGRKPHKGYNQNSPKGEVIVEYVGESGLQRRIAIGRVADVIIVINGASGTLDEVISALKNNAIVIALDYGGCGAELYASKRNNRVSEFLLGNQFKPKYLSNIFLASVQTIQDVLTRVKEEIKAKEGPKRIPRQLKLISTVQTAL